jgi:hypothetical protein
MNRRAFLLALPSAFATISTPAHACSCLPQVSLRDHIQGVSVIFIGTPIRAERHWFDRGVTTTFEVIERLKGPSVHRVRVEHGDDIGGACGVIFEPGRRHLVFAYDIGWWSLGTDSCTMATQFSEDQYRAALRR